MSPFIHFLFLMTGITLSNYGFSASPKHLQIGCSIYDQTVKIIKKFSGNQCVFLDTGEYFIMDSNANKIRKIDSKGIVIWERMYPVHHSLRFFTPENLVVATTLENSKIRGVLAEYSGIVALNGNGDLFSIFSFVKSLSNISWKIPSYHLKLRTNLRRREAPFEDVHGNAVYKIPPNILSQWHPAFEAGNYIVTLGRLYGVMILDKKLQDILWYRELPSKRYIHDAQVTPDGKILYYQNAYNSNFNSRIELIDPVQNTIVWYHPKDNSMQAPAQGGVQLLENGDYLYSDITKKVSTVVKIDKYGKELMRVPVDENPDDYQEVKELDLTSFLRNSMH